MCSSLNLSGHPCTAYLHDTQVANEASFLLQRNRLNVALSRAQRKTILLASDAVLAPSARALDTEAAKVGFSYLQSVMACATEIVVPLPF